MVDPLTTLLAVRNPRTGALDYQVERSSAETVRQVGDAARAGQVEWQARGPAHRAMALEQFAAAIEAAFGDIAASLAIDTGRTTFAQFEIVRSIELIRHWAGRIEGDLAAFNESGRSQQVATVGYRHQGVPYGLVAVISPWNVPLLLAIIDSAPALAAGCSVVLKPSEVTPRFIAPLRAALDTVPELSSVLRIVTGDGETGQAMIDVADAVCFTGSVATGRQVAAHAAERFIPAFLELGGKDPAIVLEDANPELAARAIVRSAIGMTGQACQSLERVYCLRPVYEALLEQLLAQVDALTLTLTEDGSGDIAPLIYEPQLTTIQRQIDEAVALGATLLRGGEPRVAGGIWYPPTVVVNVNHSMSLMREETFGPIIPVMCCDSVEEALTLANDSTFGLSGAVFSADVEKAADVAARMGVGAVSINDASLTGVVNDVEKNSFGFSGMGGSRMGPAGLSRFLRKRALLIQEAEPVSVSLFADQPH